MKKPDCCKEIHLNYLDELQQSGITNMYGAESYLVKEFNLPQSEARNILRYWMFIYNDRHQVDG